MLLYVQKNAAPPPLQKRTLMVKGRLTWQVMLLEDTGGLFFLRPHSLQDNTLTVKKGWHGKFCYLRSNFPLPFSYTRPYSGSKSTDCAPITAKGSYKDWHVSNQPL